MRLGLKQLGNCYYCRQKDRKLVEYLPRKRWTATLDRLMWGILAPRKRYTEDMMGPLAQHMMGSGIKQ